MIQRRKFIMAIGAAGAVGLAGCLSDDNDPEDVVEEFYAAMNDGDVETMNELIHKDSPGEGASEEDFEESEEVGFTVEETEVLEEDDDVAKVRAEITFEVEVMGEVFEETGENTLELRTEDGAWKIYSSAE